MISPVVFSIVDSTYRPLGLASPASNCHTLMGFAFAVKSKTENMVGLYKSLKNERECFV